ncbi:MAG: GNAT family N-acetyltransferase [Chloroflexota bacterium]
MCSIRKRLYRSRSPVNPSRSASSIFPINGSSTEAVTDVPISHHLQISPVLDRILRLQPARILDVGCGLGIYGALSRVYLEGLNLYDRERLTWNRKENWKFTIDCVEGFDRYITDLHRAVYNDVMIGEAPEVLSNLGDGAYDLVLAIDIIEHLEKQIGMNFIDQLKRVGKAVMVTTPSEFLEQVVPENPLEDHRSLWSRGELESLGFAVHGEGPFLLGIFPSGALQQEMRDAEGVSVRLYREGDECGIVSLFGQVFGREMSLEEWRWKYRMSYPEKVYSAVAVDDRKGIVGHYGAVCMSMVNDGIDTRGLTICDVAIHPKFRGRGLLKTLADPVPREAVKDGIRLGYGFPNRWSLLKPAISLGIYEKVEDVIEGTRATKFHNTPVRYLYRVFPLDYTDARIDLLWESCRRRIGLAVVRDRRYLAWRYRDHPSLRSELWGMTLRAGSRLAGLAVLRREGDRMLLVDFLCPREALKSLLTKIDNYARSVGASSLILWVPPFMKNAIAECGFETRQAETAVPRTTLEGTMTRDEIAGRFFYTMGDTDFL